MDMQAGLQSGSHVAVIHRDEEKHKVHIVALVCMRKRCTMRACSQRHSTGPMALINPRQSHVSRGRVY